MQTAIISLNNVNQLIFVMVKCGVLFEVRTEFLNKIWASFVFKWLTLASCLGCCEYTQPDIQILIYFCVCPGTAI
jgi:hypothetical protein